MAQPKKDYAPIYYPYDGNLRTRFNERLHDESDKIKRINKNNVNVEEVEFDSIMGHIKDFYFKQLESKAWKFNIYMTYQDEEALISFTFDDGFVFDFLNRYCTCDQSALFQVSLFTPEDEGKVKHFFMLKYSGDGGLLQKKFTKDNPQGMPEWEQKPGKVPGELEWDNSKSMRFLFSEAEKHLMLYLDSIGEARYSERWKSTAAVKPVVTQEAAHQPAQSPVNRNSAMFDHPQPKAKPEPAPLAPGQHIADAPDDDLPF